MNRLILVQDLHRNFYISRFNSIFPLIPRNKNFLNGHLIQFFFHDSIDILIGFQYQIIDHETYCQKSFSKVIQSLKELNQKKTLKDLFAFS